MISIEQVYEQIVAFARKHGVRRVLLFGSRARGDALPKSDIDLAVWGCPNFALFEEDVREHLWSLLDVDLVNLDGEVPCELLHDIQRDGKVLYEAL